MDAEKKIKELSERLTELQKPVRVLNSIGWSDEVKTTFFDRKGERLPLVDADWYKNKELGFDPTDVRSAFADLTQDINESLGESHPAGVMMRRMCHEYSRLADMLENRGTAEFGKISGELYGSTKDALGQGEASLGDFGQRMGLALDTIEPSLCSNDPEDQESMDGEEAAKTLAKRFETSMGCHGAEPTVMADDGITADAAAGANRIKLRSDACFSERELKILEVHEGWVHVGTSLNGAAQSVCTFLSKGSPSATVTQEGLAVLMEIVALVSSPKRQRRINNRILAVEMAEDGANFLEVYRFYLEQGFTEDQSYEFSVRVFRGSTAEGAPFTKDISYTKGFLQLYNFLRATMHHGQLQLITLLFYGKTALEDMGQLKVLRELDLLKPPEFIPMPFRDLHGLAAWMCYEGVLSECSSEPLQKHYAKLIG